MSALPGIPISTSAASSGKRLPPIPAVDDLAGDRLVHVWRDLYNLPTTQNELGYVQAAKSVSGITALSMPPFACCGVPEMPWSPGFLLTCEIFLNGRILISYSPGGDTLAYRWYPHRFVRETEADGLQFTTETFMPSNRRAAAQSIRVKNLGSGSRKITLGFDIRAAVTKKTTAWFVNSPGEADNKIHWDESRGALIFEAQHSPAVSVQGISPKPIRVEGGRMLVFELTLGPGETKQFNYVNTVEGSAQAALASYDALQSNFAQIDRDNEADFNRLLKSAFTPGNTDFSGYRPQIETDDESLWQLYQAGFRNLLFARRASPDSKYGTTYITLGGHVIPTLSFPWDTSLTSLSLALLDPEALRHCWSSGLCRTCISISPLITSAAKRPARGMASTTWRLYAARKTTCGLPETLPGSISGLAKARRWTTSYRTPRIGSSSTKTAMVWATTEKSRTCWKS